MTCTCTTPSATPTCCRCGCASTTPGTGPTPPPSNPSASVPGTAPPKATARQPEPLPPPPPPAPKRARLPEELPVPAVALRTARVPAPLPPPEPVGPKQARLGEALSSPGPIPTHRTVLKNPGVQIGEGPTRRANGEVVGESLTPPAEVAMHRKVARQPEALPVGGAPKRANGEVVGEQIVSDGVVRRGSGEALVEAPSRVQAKAAPELTTSGMRGKEVRALEAPERVVSAVVVQELTTAGMTGKAVKAVEKPPPPSIPSAGGGGVTYPTTASFPDPENTPLVVTWTFTDTGPLPLQVARPDVEPVSETAPAAPAAGTSAARVSPELRARLDAGGGVRARFVFQLSRPIRAFLDDELNALLRGEAAVGTEASRRAAWFAREARASAPERSRWASSLRTCGLKVVEQGQLVPYVDVEGPASAVRAALAVAGLVSADVPDAREQVDAWGADIRAALGLNPVGVTGAGAGGGLMGAYRGDGLVVGIYEGTLFPYHPALAVGPPGLRETRPGACADLSSARLGMTCRVTPAESRVISVRDCSVNPCVERVGEWTVEAFWERNTGGGHALGSAHVLAGDLTLGQDPWYEQKLGPADGARPNVRRLGSGLLPAARLVSWGAGFARAVEDVARADVAVRTLSWSGGAYPLRSNSAEYSDGRTGPREAAAWVLYAAGIALVKSAGNRNENLRLPTFDELLDAVEAKLGEHVARLMWPGGVPSIIFPVLPSANPPRRMSRVEYRASLAHDDRGWLLRPRHEEVTAGRARAYEFVGHEEFWAVTRELRIPAPVMRFKPQTRPPNFCREQPDSNGTLSVIGPWCALPDWRALVDAPTPCVPGRGVYCNIGAPTVGSPSAQTVIVVAARQLGAAGPGGPDPISSMGGAFQPDGGPRLARTVITSAGFAPFNRPALPSDGGPTWQGYGVEHGQTSGATPTIAAVVSALQQRLAAVWAASWVDDPRPSDQLAHPGLIHALLLALGDGAPLGWRAAADFEHLSGLSTSFGSGSPDPGLVRWVLGEGTMIQGRRRVLSVGLLRRVRPGTTTRLPRHTPGGGGRLRSSRAGAFFVDPLYDATGTGRVPLTLRLVEGAALAGATTLASDGGEVAGATDAVSVENRRRVYVRWPGGRSGDRPTRWQIRVPALADATLSPLVWLDVFYALVEEWES